jgi:hypothetical protein
MDSNLTVNRPVPDVYLGYTPDGRVDVLRIIYQSPTRNLSSYKARLDLEGLAGNPSRIARLAPRRMGLPDPPVEIP